MIHDEEIVIEFQKQSIIKELKCIICYNLPVEPQQCLGCDTIICKGCIYKLGKYRCPIRCSNQIITEIKPKTRLLYETIIIKCRGCNKSISLLELNKHFNKCKMGVLSISNLSTACDTNLSVGLELTTIKPTKSIRTTFWYMKTLSIGVMALLVMLVSAYFCIYSTFFNKLNYRTVCLADNIYTIVGLDSLCLFSFGFISFGVFSVGIISIGIFGVGIAVIGLLMGLGQAVVSLGVVPYSQGAIASYIIQTQIGIALIKIRKAVCGLQCFHSLFTNDDYLIENYDN